MTEHAGRSLSFRIAGRDFALPLLRTLRIMPLPPLTRVPGTPPHILGAFNLVGRVVPVVDVAAKLGFGATFFGDRNCVVVADVPLGDESAALGILVEAVGDVVDDGAVEPLDLLRVVEEQ